MTVRVPAKVNLHLSVGDVRRDGFHEVISVYQAVSVFDEVTLEPDAELTVTVEGAGADVVPRGDENLAVRAVRAVAALVGHDPDVHIRIRKGIPVAGGMAGGSADAAGALVAVDALWGLDLDRDTLDGLAAGLGSDVPFSLHGGTALGTGRGERLSPVLVSGQFHWVFALSGTGLSTPEVYHEFDRLRGDEAFREPVAPDAVLAALRAGDATALGLALTNDLQAAALRLQPALGRVLEAGRDLGAVGAVVSGSGPTVALLARTDAAANDIAAALPGFGLCAGVRRATGPVPGARVVPDGA